MGDDQIRVTATAIRIPVVGGHSESVNVELKSASSVADIRQLLHNSAGVVVQDNPETNTYPMPIYAEVKDDVFVDVFVRTSLKRTPLTFGLFQII